VANKNSILNVPLSYESKGPYGPLPGLVC